MLCNTVCGIHNGVVGCEILSIYIQKMMSNHYLTSKSLILRTKIAELGFSFFVKSNFCNTMFGLRPFACCGCGFESGRP